MVKRISKLPLALVTNMERGSSAVYMPLSVFFLWVSYTPAELCSCCMEAPHVSSPAVSSALQIPTTGDMIVTHSVQFTKVKEEENKTTARKCMDLGKKSDPQNCVHSNLVGVKSKLTAEARFDPL